jgi:hypothetical protein
VNDAGTRRIKLERFPWDGLKFNFGGAFIDERNGLWINGDSMRLARYALPETPTTAPAN